MQKVFGGETNLKQKKVGVQKEKKSFTKGYLDLKSFIHKTKTSINWLILQALLVIMK